MIWARRARSSRLVSGSHQGFLSEAAMPFSPRPRRPNVGWHKCAACKVHGRLLSGDSFLNSAAWRSYSCSGTLTLKGPEEGSAPPVGLVIRRRAGSVLGHLLHSLKKLDGSRSLKQTTWQGRRSRADCDSFPPAPQGSKF